MKNMALTGALLFVLFSCMCPPCPSERVWNFGPLPGLLQYIEPGDISPGNDKSYYTDEQLMEILDITEDDLKKILNKRNAVGDET